MKQGEMIDELNAVPQIIPGGHRKMRVLLKREQMLHYFLKNSGFDMEP
jgi:hypothetical protein